MKTFRKIYYIVLPILALALCTLTFLNGYVSSPKSSLDESEVRGYAISVASSSNYDAYENAYTTTAAQYEARGNITSAITEGLRTNRFSTYYNSIGNTDTKMNYVSASGSSLSELLVSSYSRIVDGESETVWTLTPVFHSKVYSLATVDLAKIPTLNDDFGAMSSVRVQNVVAYVPGTKTRNAATINPIDHTFSIDEAALGDVILLTAHYDSTVGDNGYANNGVAVGSLISMYRKLALGEIECENDVLFVFTDSSYKSGLGLGAFLYTDLYDEIFAGVKNRITIAANFSGAKGNGSSVILGGATNTALNEVAGFAATGNKQLSSSFVGSLFRSSSANGDFKMMSDLTAIDFLTLGDENAITYESDLNSSLINQTSALVSSFVDYFKDKDLGAIKSGVAAGFYSYLNADFYYPAFLSYIWGVLILAVLGVAAYFIVRRKSYDLRKTGFGALVALLSAICTAVSCFAVYLISALVLSLVKVINISSIFTLVIDNPAFTIAAFVAAFAFYCAFCSILRSAFDVKSTDAVRGGAMLSALAGAVWCFVSPSTAYFMSILALGYAVVLLVSTLTKDAFKAKFGFDIERMFIYAFVACVILPISLGEAVLLSKFALACVSAVFFAALSPFFASIAPYADYFARAIFPAKETEYKGEATEKADLSTANQTVYTAKQTNYSARSIVCVATAVVSALVFTFSGLFGGNTVTRSHLSGSDGIYKNSITYAYSYDGAESSKKFVIKDMDFYAKYKSELSKFKWSASDKAYVLADDTADSSLPVHSDGPIVQLEGNKNMFVLENKTSNVELVTVTVIADSADIAIGYVNIVKDLSADSVTTKGMLSTSFTTVKSNDGKSVSVTFPVGYGARNAIEVFTSKMPASGEANIKIKVEEKIICGDIYGFGILDDVASNNSIISSIRTDLSGYDDAPNIYVNMVCDYELGPYMIFENK
jgi:hypothetical protein